MPVVRYVPPEEFEHLGELARRMGFEHVAAGPVRAFELSRTQK